MCILIGVSLSDISENRCPVYKLTASELKKFYPLRKFSVLELNLRSQLALVLQKIKVASSAP